MKNAKGSIWYGMHFYPGVAEYQEPKKEPFRVFLNEDTLRSMDASFAGKPIFVMHVDEVESDLDVLRGEADGWVVESFYNAADGKHWCKMVICSEEAERAISQGMKLSNCYLPKSFGEGGLWNGVSYDKEVKGGEYEHLAIVPNPRYEESIILSPEDFKAYNEEKKLELSKIANHKGVTEMGLSFFKRTKVENSLDIESTMVQLPKSKREVSLAVLVNEADEHEKEKKENEEKEKKGEPKMADESHHVEVGEGKMTVKELKDCYNALKEEHGKMKDSESSEYGEEGSKDPGNDDEMEDSLDDVEAKKSAEKLAAHEEEEIKEAKKKNAAEKADRLKNANKRQFQNEETPAFDLFEKVNRGKTRYGS